MEYVEICNNDLYLAIKAMENNVKIYCDINSTVYDRLSINDTADEITLANSNKQLVMNLNDFVTYCIEKMIVVKVLIK